MVCIPGKEFLALFFIYEARNFSPYCILLTITRKVYSHFRQLFCFLMKIPSSFFHVGNDFLNSQLKGCMCTKIHLLSFIIWRVTREQFAVLWLETRVYLVAGENPVANKLVNYGFSFSSIKLLVFYISKNAFCFP